MELEPGMTAVVTGAASGIGRALAETFAARKLAVVCADVDEAQLAAVVTELRATGAEAEGIRCDIAVDEDVQRLRDATLQRFGAVEVLCNNAGVWTSASLASDLDVAAWRRVIDVNVFGVLNGVASFLPLFLAQGRGHIVNTASRQGLIATAGRGAYCASKAAVVSLSETLHKELEEGRSPVGVSVLCPGPVLSRMTPASFLATALPARDVAELVARAIEKRRLFVSTHRETVDCIHEIADQVEADADALGCLA